MRTFCFILFLWPFSAVADLSCGGQIACMLDNGRSYHVRVPDDWDGVSKLPVLLHFHGWGRQGDLIVQHDRIVSATRKRGVLLVAPNGQNRSWNFWRQDTDDVSFARQVLSDVSLRYPVDADLMFVSGYSFGAAMAWRFACDDGADIHALLAIAGTLEQSQKCATAPQHIRHVHGLDDTVMDFPRGAGDDGTFPVALWRASKGCETASELGPWQQVPWLVLNRTLWEDCADGTVTLDTHPGGHFIPHGWIARQLDELLDLPPSYP